MKPTRPPTGTGAEISHTMTSQSRLGLMLADKNILRLAAVAVFLFVGLGILAPEHFLSTANFGSMAVQMTGFGLFALAMLVPMLTGGIDLSVISLANLSAIIGANVMTYLASGDSLTSTTVVVAVAIGLVAAILVGMIGGIVNGAIIAKIGVSPILATLATSLIYLGIALVITSGSAVTGLPSAFGWLGSGSVALVPFPLVVFAGAALLVAFLLTSTAFGTKVYLFGTNPLASRFAGINNVEVTLKTYLLSGGLASIAGIMIAARANSAKADYASSYLLLSILVCVLGGVNPLGGSGKVLGVVLAVVALQFLSSGLNILDVSNFATDFVWGGLLLIVMSVNQFGNTARG